MSLDTPRFALSYPQDSDSPNAPAQIHDLALDVETRLGYAGAQGGKSIITAEQSRTNAAYGFLGTHDEVVGLVLPNDNDVICVRFQGMLKSSVADAARAALFIGSDQFKIALAGSSAPQVTEAPSKGTDSYVSLGSFFGGLVAGIETPYTGDVATGQGFGIFDSGSAAGVVAVPSAGGNVTNVRAGGACEIHGLAAGTYTISVQVKASSGSATMKNRKLYAWTKEFPTSGI